jgi:N-acetylglucosaminyldiphosphoundecaprenol N-acetyl-beta-D-mannosaminyltransferase
MSSPAFAWPSKFDVLGIGVSPTNYHEASSVIVGAAKRGLRGVVSCHAVHSIITAAGDPALRNKVNTFDMITPDGQPVRWALNLLHGLKLRDRVYGPALMLELCREATAEEVPIYLYGGSPQVVELLRSNLGQAFPGLRIVGSESPPYRELTPEEDAAMVGRINASGARLVFVGLGCPKQDHFAFDHRDRIDAIQLCVGAAFDFHAGAKRVAPAWMQRCGLEWLFRLIQEPRRLWRRYLVTNTLFVAKLAAALGRKLLGRPPAVWSAALSEPSRCDRSLPT